MRIAFPISCGIALIGVIMLVVFRLIGSDVDEDGILREPFALLSVGYTLLALGVIGALVSYAIAGRR